MDIGSPIRRTAVTTLLPEGESSSTQTRSVGVDRERRELIDAISRAVQAIPTERPLVVVLDSDPEPDPSSPLILRVVPLDRAAVGRPETLALSLPLSAEICRDSDQVTITWGDEVARVRSSKGIVYLARLLAAPNQELHVLVVASPRERSGPPADPVLNVGKEDAGPLLDSKAKEAYRRRIRELQEEIDEAESFNDPVRASRARDELAFIADHLSGALGLGGRDRRAASNTERARVNVTKRIKAAIERISSQAPNLGRHLEATIRTGTYLSYASRSEPTIDWKIDLG